MEPAKLFEEEKSSLLNLPSKRYVGWNQEVRKLTSNCFISFNGSRYSVPYIYSGKNVWIKVSKGYTLQIFNQANKLIAEHPISMVKGKTIYKEEHFKGYKTEYPNFEHISSLFLKEFPDYKLFTDRLYAQKKYNPRWHLARIFELSSQYTKQDFMQALDKSLQYNMFNLTFIAGYLEKNHKHTLEIKPGVKPDFPKENIIRNLNEYKINQLTEKTGI